MRSTSWEQYCVFVCDDIRKQRSAFKMYCKWHLKWGKVSRLFVNKCLCVPDLWIVSNKNEFVLILFSRVGKLIVIFNGFYCFFLKRTTQLTKLYLKEWVLKINVQKINIYFLWKMKVHKILKPSTVWAVFRINVVPHMWSFDVGPYTCFYSNISHLK